MTCRACQEDKPADEFEQTASGGRRRKCKTCVYADRRAWKAANKDQVNARERERYHANGDAQRERSRAYAASHVDQRRARYAANREARVASSVSWQEENRERYRQNLRAHRARKHGVPTERYETAEVYQQSNGRCFCGKPWMLEEYGPDGWVIDHVTAMKHGGPDYLSNTQVACFGCNARKSIEESRIPS